MRHTWGVIDRVPSFTCISPHVRNISSIEGIWHDQEALNDAVGSKMINKLGVRGELCDFNKNQTREILREF